jgi:hypothetical protein
MNQLTIQWKSLSRLEMIVEMTTNELEKSKVVAEIGNVETRLAKYESNLRAKQDELSSSKPNYTSGTALFVIGLVLILIGYDAGTFLIILSLLAAGLVAVSTSGKSGAIKKEMEMIENEIASTRGKLAELRAKLIIL